MVPGDLVSEKRPLAGSMISWKSIGDLVSEEADVKLTADLFSKCCDAELLATTPFHTHAEGLVCGLCFLNAR